MIMVLSDVQLVGGCMRLEIRSKHTYTWSQLNPHILIQYGLLHTHTHTHTHTHAYPYEEHQQH
jgi:hypothetical protein